MGDVEVTAEDDWFGRFKGFAMREEIYVPLLGAVVEALGALVLVVTLRVGCVNRDEKVVFKLGGQDATFIVVFFDAEAVLHREWRCFTDDCCARIALFYGAIPVSVRVTDKCKAID